jgi:acetyl/propionyl-CoA carboxylase alpha subunit
MIAKLIADGSTRDERSTLAGALAETEVEGVTTNLPVPALARRPSRAPRR